MRRRAGILYESNEWSDWELHRRLQDALGRDVAMINMEDESALDKALECDVLVSRVFASATFRGHTASASRMMSFIHGELPPNIELINPRGAHEVEVSKARAAELLASAGMVVPRVQALGWPGELCESIAGWDFPCVIKPDCGGRTTHTSVLRDEQEAKAFLDAAPDLLFIVEDFIPAREGFMTRMELVDGSIALIVKRSIAKNGLSSYHEGSTYELYPNCPENVQDVVSKAAETLDIQFGSFDVIESADGNAYIIDANSVSNVSEDCTELFEGFDLMKEYACALAVRIDGEGLRSQ